MDLLPNKHLSTDSICFNGEIEMIRVENLESSGHKKATMRGNHPFMCTIEYRQDKQNLPRHVVIVFFDITR
ncbi:hypothetical protein AB3S75_018629 [Citrus x aurantiifolia]